MDSFEINNYLEIISFIREKCANEISLNKKIKTEQDFYCKYSFLDVFNYKFKSKELFDKYNIENDKYQTIIKCICPNIDFISINKKRKLKNFFEEALIISLFFYLFSNEFYIMYKYNNKRHDNSLNNLYTKQENTINELSNKVDKLSIMYNNIEESINNRTLSAKVINLEDEIVDQNDVSDSLNLFLKSTISEYNSKLQQINTIINYGQSIIKDVPTINQYPDYPSGCESISLLILLRYAGVNVTAKQIVDSLIKAERPYYVSAERYGNDPEIYFIGNPTDVYGFGVYEKPIISVSSNFKSGIKNITGSSLNEVLRVVIEKHPVQVWVAMDGISTHYAYSWTDELTGRTINYPAEFHSLVIIGFNQFQIITSDPSVGKIRYFDRYNFEQSFNFFGKRAIYYE